MVSYLTAQAQPSWDQQRWPHTQNGYSMAMPAPMSYSPNNSLASSHDIRSYHPHISSNNGPPHSMVPASFHGSQYDSRPPAYQPSFQFNANPYQGQPPVSFESLRSGYEPREPSRNTSPFDSSSSVSSYGQHWSSSVHSSPRSTAYAVQPQQDVHIKHEIKDVTPIAFQRPEDAPVYNTGVDVVMRSIQALKMKSTSSTPATSPGSDSAAPSPPASRAKPFVCNINGCDHSFGQKSHLKQHQKTHDGTKEYVCDLCGKRCSQKENLADHRRAHLDQRDHKCLEPGCTQAFTSRGSLNNHKKLHSPNRQRYKCHLDNCEKDFATPGNLKQHQCKFHEAELKRIHALVTSCADFNDLDHLGPRDAFLVRNMAELHKNSNKGIKGRGKGNKVNMIHKLKCRCSSASYGRVCEVHMHSMQRRYEMNPYTISRL